MGVKAWVRDDSGVIAILICWIDVNANLMGGVSWHMQSKAEIKKRFS
mgnify:CR=1 FL=1